MNINSIDRANEMSPPNVLTLQEESCLLRWRISLVLALLTVHCISIPFEDRDLTADVLRLANEKAVAGTFSGVIVIAREDRILLARAFGMADRQTSRPNTVDTRFDVASLGKMFTSVAVAQLVERGVLSFDAPVGRYLPRFPNERIAGEVTIHHLLTHTSGIPDLPDALFNAPPANLVGYLPFFGGATLEFPPGAQRSYSNSGFVLLGLVVEAVTRQPYEDYVARHVFRPAGMTSVSFRRSDDQAIGYRKNAAGEWEPNTASIAPHGGPHGGVLLAAGDLVKFFHALRHGTLLKPSTAATITTPRPGAPAPYGFGELAFATDRLVGHSGGNIGISADAYTYWQSGYTIIVLSNFEPPASHEIAGAARKLLEPRFRAAG